MAEIIVIKKDHPDAEFHKRRADLAVDVAKRYEELARKQFRLIENLAKAFDLAATTYAGRKFRGARAELYGQARASAHMAIAGGFPAVPWPPEISDIES